MKHVHGGRSSSELLDGPRLLASLGLAKGETVLDAGCGDGYLSVIASGIVGSGGTVHAVDVFEEPLARLRVEVDRKGMANLNTFKADITDRIPLDDGVVDTCLLVNVLHGFVVNGEDEKALGEITRVMKRGGRLVVAEFKTTAEGADADDPGPPMAHRVSRSCAVERVSRFGLDSERSFDAGPRHYTVVFRKR